MLQRTIGIYKDSFGGLQSTVWLLSALQLINRSGTMVLPFMSMYMTQKLGATLSQAGVVLMCFGLGAIVGSFAGGKLTDNIGHRKVMIGSLFTGGIFFIFLGYLKNYQLICLFSFLLSAINEAFRPANMAAIGSYSDETNRTRSSSLVRLSVNLGWAVGASIGGWIAAHNYQYLFWVDGTTNLVAAGFAMIFLPKGTEEGKRQKKSDETGLVNSVWKDSDYLIFVLLKFLYAICFFQLFSTLPVFLKTIYVLGEHQIGWVMALNGLLIAIFEMVIVFKLSQKNNYQAYIFIGTILMGISFIILNFVFTNLFAMALISSIIITAAEILTMPFMMGYMLNRAHPSNLGQYASLYVLAFAGANVVGPLTGSMIADHYGFNFLWWCVCGLCILTAFGYVLLFKRTSQKVVTSQNID